MTSIERAEALGYYVGRRAGRALDIVDCCPGITIPQLCTTMLIPNGGSYLRQIMSILEHVGVIEFRNRGLYPVEEA
jgi:hypothetical protein